MKVIQRLKTKSSEFCTFIQNGIINTQDICQDISQCGFGTLGDFQIIENQKVYANYCLY